MLHRYNCCWDRLQTPSVANVHQLSITDHKFSSTLLSETREPYEPVLSSKYDLHYNRYILIEDIPLCLNSKGKQNV